MGDTVQAIWSALSAPFWNLQELFMSPATYVYLFWVLLMLYRVLSILWTMKDISSRTTSIAWQVLAVLLVSVWTPFVGLPIYLFLRPMRYNRDRLGWRESLNAQVASCPSCAKKNPLHHEFCTYCGQQMTVKCKECKSSYQWAFDYCPQCGGPNVE
jgi:hypothetical protein